MTELDQAKEEFEEKNPLKEGDEETPETTETPETPEVPETPVTPEEPKEEPKSDLNEIKESLNKLSEGLTDFSSRLDRLETPPTPEVPEEPVEGWDKDKPAPTGWGEVRSKITETSEETTRRILKEEREKEQNTLTERERVVQGINTAVDERVAIAEEKGIMPKIVDRDNPTDPGRLFRQQVFGIMAKMDTIEVEEPARLVKEMNSKGYKFDYRVNDWVKVNDKPSGADSPVGSPNTTTPETPKIDPAFVHKNRRDLGTIAETFGNS